jgi:hypothetical protein
LSATDTASVTTIHPAPGAERETPTAATMPARKTAFQRRKSPGETEMPASSETQAGNPTPLHSSSAAWKR